MVTLVNRAKVATASVGTGTITLGAAESGYQTFADAGVANADVVRYVIEDGDAWEIGTGTYSAGTLTRVLGESSTGSLLNLTGNAVVFVSATEADLREQRVGVASAVSGGSYENVYFDLSTGTIFNRTLSADTYADFVNPPASGTGYEFLLKITGGYAVVGYDLSAASYDSTSFSVSTQELTPNGLSFSPDGHKLFVVGSGTDNVYEYDLWASFELSTASYSGVSFSVGGQDSTPTGIAFSLDGTKMYIVGSKNDRVHQYTLSTSFDLSTASYDSVSILVQSQDGSPAGLSFSPDGYKMFMVGYSTDTVYEYDLSTSFDLSSAVYSNNSFSVGGQVTIPTSVSFSADGTKMFVVGSGTDNVYQYTLLAGFFLSTASYDNVSFSVAGQDISPQGIVFSADGAKMFMVGSTTDTVYQYNTGSYPVAYIDYPASITWLDGVAPTNYPPAGSTLALQFFTTDGGVTYYGSKLGSPALATVATTGAYSDLSGLPTIPAAYTDANVDTHLNTGTAASGEVLSWTGTDYDWIAAGGGGGPVRLARSSIGGFSQIPPIDLGYYHSAGANFNINQTSFVPWVAPVNGTIDGISVYFSTNNVTTSQEVAMGVYADNEGSPSTRLSFGTFDPNGLGLGWKSITGLSQSVTQNALYWLAISTNAVSGQIQCRTYRRNGFMPRPATSTVNDDQSLIASGQVSSMTTAPTFLSSTSSEPFLIAATYL